MASWLSSNGNSTNDRISRSVYDQDGRLRFSVQDAQVPSDGGAIKDYVTQYIYNQAGQVIKTIRYADRYTVLESASKLSDLLALVPATPPSTAQVTQFIYDIAGRL